MRKVVGILITSLVIFVLSSTKALASEGIVELRNVIGGDSRCFATSVLMPDFQYTILITCRDLIYPVSPEFLSYGVWATPTDGGNPVKLGELSLGKVEFRTKNAFSNIFVTQEHDSSVRTPGGALVMRGSVQQIPLLKDSSQAKEPESPAPPAVTPFPTQAPRTGILSNIRGGIIITVISIFLIIVMLILVKPFK
jgi:hypothetical protein